MKITNLVKLEHAIKRELGISDRYIIKQMLAPSCPHTHAPRNTRCVLPNGEVR